MIVECVLNVSKRMHRNMTYNMERQKWKFNSFQLDFTKPMRNL